MASMCLNPWKHWFSPPPIKRQAKKCDLSSPLFLLVPLYVCPIYDLPAVSRCESASPSVVPFLFRLSRLSYSSLLTLRLTLGLLLALGPGHVLSWCDVSWRGLSWHDLSWHGLSWHGLSWRGLSWHGLPGHAMPLGAWPVWCIKI